MTFAPLYLSHGSPLTVIEESETARFLRDRGARIGTPAAILVMSSHWPSASVRLGGAERPRTIHDFYGFPDELYKITYPAPGAPEVAARAAALLGNGAVVDPDRGLDHGVWGVLRRMWPDGDVPVVPMTVLPGASPTAHFELGRLLAPLADQGVQIIGSGAATHNLEAYLEATPNDPPHDWVIAFTTWLAEKAERGETADLLDYRARAPFARQNHPTDEHLLPFFMALGAGKSGTGQRIHQATEYGVIAMDAYAFGAG